MGDLERAEAAAWAITDKSRITHRAHDCPPECPNAAGGQVEPAGQPGFGQRLGAAAPDARKTCRSLSRNLFFERDRSLPGQSGYRDSVRLALGGRAAGISREADVATNGCSRRDSPLSPAVPPDELLAT